MRLRIPQWITPELDDAAIEERIKLRDARGTLWSGGVAKFFADGVIDAGTAWLEAPDTHGEGITPFWPDPERMAAVMTRFAEAGFQLATHTIGDAAVRFTLGTYIRAGAADGVRHRLEHLEALPDDLVQSIPRAGVVASMQPVHLPRCAATAPATGTRGSAPSAPRARSGCATWWTRARSSPSAATGRSPTPTPATASPPPSCGGSRPRRRSSPCSPDQAFTAEEALAGYTTAPALVAGDAAVAGRIRVGMRADLTGLGVDPIKAPPSELPDNPVWLTVVGGRVAFANEDVRPGARPASFAHG